MRAPCFVAFVILPSVACGSAGAEQPAVVSAAGPTTAAAAVPAAFATTTVALPGGGPDGVAMDYLVYDPRTNAVWVPAGNTGVVDVIDVATGKLSTISGFATQDVERRGKQRRVGPSAAALGDTGIVYVGNRGDSSICAVDERTLARGACTKLDASPDGIQYVARTHEVWVTTPRDHSIRVLDATTLAQRARVVVDGQPEGFAADNQRGRFYTNLEDKDRTLAIDLTSRTVVATWKPECGDDGAHGLRLAEPEGVLLVACGARLESLDVAHDGARLGSVDIGEGVDDFDYAAADHRVYAGAAEAAKLTVAAMDPHGGLTVVATVAIQDGARNGVVTRDGRVYLSHAKASELIVVAPAAAR
jgi:DNA-binding beta-propeller fold protein YncE